MGAILMNANLTVKEVYKKRCVQILKKHEVKMDNNYGQTSLTYYGRTRTGAPIMTLQIRLQLII